MPNEFKWDFTLVNLLHFENICMLSTVIIYKLIFETSIKSVQNIYIKWQMRRQNRVKY